MSDVEQYIEERRRRDPEFAEGFDAGFTDFKIGVLLRQTREAAGLTQEQVADRLGYERSTIANLVRLLELPEEIQAAVSRETLRIQWIRKPCSEHTFIAEI